MAERRDWTIERALIEAVLGPSSDFPYTDDVWHGMIGSYHAAVVRHGRDRFRFIEPNHSSRWAESFAELLALLRSDALRQEIGLPPIT